MHRFKFLVVLVVALLPASLALVPVGASPLSANSRHPGVQHLFHSSSANWSGYAVETNLSTPASNAVSDVKGQWTVPTVTCDGQTAYSSIWVGIDGYSDSTVEQTGTEQDCIGAAPRYYAWFEMYPHAAFKIGLTVHPGDVISAEVRWTHGSTYALTLNNVTSGVHSVTSRNLSGAGRQSAEWIVEAPSSSSGILPLANYGTATFTNAGATINGLTSTIAEPTWQYDPITMTELNSSAPRSTPGSLTAGGSSFTTTWDHL